MFKKQYGDILALLHYAACCFEQTLEAAPHKSAVVRALTANLTNHPCKMLGNAGEIKMIL